MWTDRKDSKRLEKRTDMDTHYKSVCVCVFVYEGRQNGIAAGRRR